MASARMYPDADGTMKPFEELSTRGFTDNVAAGAFVVGDCAADGHLLGQITLRSNPPMFPCARCNGLFHLIDGEYRPVPRY